MVKTNIIKSMNGHTVKFTIGVQTFSLSECLSEEDSPSIDKAKRLQIQLNNAFSNINK